MGCSCGGQECLWSTYYYLFRHGPAAKFNYKCHSKAHKAQEVVIRKLWIRVCIRRGLVSRRTYVDAAQVTQLEWSGQQKNTHASIANADAYPLRYHEL